MTKTLTEQWKNGELENGFYYIKTRWFGCDNKWHYNKEQDIDYLDSDGDWCGVANDSVVEIIGGVPSNDEYKRLQERLEIATKALKRIDPPNIIFDDYRNSGIDLWEIAHNALKEMEGIK